MFFDTHKRHKKMGLRLSFTLLFCALLAGCEEDETYETRWPGASAEEAFSLATPVQEVFTETLSFHSKVTGFNSFTFSAFEPGKITRLNVREGQFVIAGETLATLYSPNLAEKIDQAEAKLRTTNAQLKLDFDRLGRSINLYDAQLIAKQDLDEVKRDFEIATQAKNEAKAALLLAKNEFAGTTIAAHEEGVVSQIFKRAGDYVSAGEALFRFESASKQKVSFNLPEKIAIGIAIGDTSQIFVPVKNSVLAVKVVEKSLPTQSKTRLHKITYEVSVSDPSLLGLRVVLQQERAGSTAFKIDYRALRYDVRNEPYLIVVSGELIKVPVTLLAMRQSHLVVQGEFNLDSRILMGNEATVPVNLYRL